MALTEDLQIYKSMYDLLRLLISARNGFDKTYKYVVGDKLVDRALECITLIHYANEDRKHVGRPSSAQKPFLHGRLADRQSTISTVGQLQGRSVYVLDDVHQKAP